MINKHYYFFFSQLTSAHRPKYANAIESERVIDILITFSCFSINRSPASQLAHSLAKKRTHIHKTRLTTDEKHFAKHFISAAPSLRGSFGLCVFFCFRMEFQLNVDEF